MSILELNKKIFRIKIIIRLLFLIKHLHKLKTKLLEDNKNSKLIQH